MNFFCDIRGNAPDHVRITAEQASLRGVELQPEPPEGHDWYCTENGGGCSCRMAKCVGRKCEHLVAIKQGAQ